MNFLYDINQFSNICNFTIKTNKTQKNVLNHYYYEFIDNEKYRSYIDFSKKKIQNKFIFIHINFIRVSSKYRGKYLGMYMMFYFFISQCNNKKYKYKITLSDITINELTKKSFYDHFGFKKSKNKKGIFDKNLKLNNHTIPNLNQKITYFLLKIQNNDIYNLKYKTKLLRKINDENINSNCKQCI